MKNKYCVMGITIFLILFQTLLVSSSQIKKTHEDKLIKATNTSELNINILPNTIPFWIPDWRVFVEIASDHPRILHWQLKVYHGVKNWTISSGSIVFNKFYDIIYIPYSFQDLPFKGYGFGKCYLRVKFWSELDNIVVYDSARAFAIGPFIRISG